MVINAPPPLTRLLMGIDSDYGLMENRLEELIENLCDGSNRYTCRDEINRYTCRIEDVIYCGPTPPLENIIVKVYVRSYWCLSPLRSNDFLVWITHKSKSEILNEGGLESIALEFCFNGP